jgi:hypothetical protein
MSFGVGSSADKNIPFLKAGCLKQRYSKSELGRLLNPRSERLKI